MTGQRSQGRSLVVWESLIEWLGSAPRSVLDVGGGTGEMAVRLASLGHRVHVVDPSPDALAALSRRATEAGVKVESRQGDLDGLDQFKDFAGAFDLVLCHGVLEFAADPQVALERLASVLKGGGALSLLVAQRASSVLARAMAGQFAEAAAMIDSSGPVGKSGRRFSAAELRALVEQGGFEIDFLQGNRIFSDWVPAGLIDGDGDKSAALAALERKVARDPEYIALASQLHLVTRVRA